MQSAVLSRAEQSYHTEEKHHYFNFSDAGKELSCENLFTSPGHLREGGQGLAQGLESANTGRDHGLAQGTERGSPHVLIPVSDEHGKEKRKGRKKDFLLSAQGF